MSGPPLRRATHRSSPPRQPNHLWFSRAISDLVSSAMSSLTWRLRQDRILGAHELGNALFGEREHLLELSPAEGKSFGGSLNLDEAARPGHHDVHVDLCAGVL